MASQFENQTRGNEARTGNTIRRRINDIDRTMLALVQERAELVQLQAEADKWAGILLRGRPLPMPGQTAVAGPTIEGTKTMQ